MSTLGTRTLHGARRTAFAVATAGFVAASCAVGPHFTRPAPPKTDRYTSAEIVNPIVAREAADQPSQHLLFGQGPASQWWTLYRSTGLDSLVQQALTANPTMQAAQATLRQAHENMLAAAGVWLPSIDLGAGAARQRISGAQFGPNGRSAIFNLFNASVDVSYGLDIFGGARREYESLRALVDYQRYALDATYLTLTGNVVTTAIAEASLRAQIAATEQIIAASTRRLDLVEAQRRLGAASGADVLAQRTLLAEDRASLPALRNQLERQRSLLATLVGKLPSEELHESFELKDLTLPDLIPVAVPSQLVRQRPDIQQQEALLHESSALVGVATAQMLPQLTLRGSYGAESTEWADVFKASSRTWNVGANLVQPLIHGGQLRHRRRAAIAAYDAAAAQYRETVLNAFRDVADSLRALGDDAELLDARSEFAQSAARSRELAEKQYSLGAVGFPTLLEAQRAEHQAAVSLIQAQAARLADTAALFQALGGGLP